MNRIVRVGLLLAAAGLVRAQEGQPKITPAIIEVKYADANRIAALLGSIYGGSLRADANLHAIAVSGSPDLVNAITAAIKKLDVPQVQPDVELTVYLVMGLAQGQGADDVPQDLTSTTRQLHSLFAYKSYKLTDTVILRGRTLPRGENGNTLTEASGVLPGQGELRYRVSYRTLNVSTEAPRTVHVTNLAFTIMGHRTVRTVEKNLSNSSEISENPASISTDLDAREGQKTVVGKSSINAAGDALILVIVPKVID